MTHDPLSALAATISARRAADAGASYSRQLLDAGPERCAKKFGEEAIEAVIARPPTSFIICLSCSRAGMCPGAT
jgi:hypothetical protein